MTKEEKDLLIKDLCARLPYGAKCKFFYTENKKSAYGISFLETEMSFENIEWLLNHKDDFVDMKPYLRPMSSMTEEEYKEWHYLYLPLPHKNEATETERRIDWLNAHHFDYRGLIEKGLALEAPEGMYRL